MSVEVLVLVCQCALFMVMCCYSDQRKMLAGIGIFGLIVVET